MRMENVKNFPGATRQSNNSTNNINENLNYAN